MIQDIHILNVGAFVWTTIVCIIFLIDTIFNEVVCAHLSNLTLKTSCHFKKLFESLGTMLSIQQSMEGISVSSIQQIGTRTMV